MVFVVALVGSPAAAGLPTLILTGLTVEPGQVRFTLTAHDAGPLDPEAVKVLAGTTELATTVSLTGSTLPRAAMAVLDATTRVPAAQFDTARAAVGALADALPADVRLGLVLVGAKATAVIPPTLDRASVRQALAGAVRAGTTGLPAGVTVAADALRAAGLSATADRRVYVFTDGKDASADLTDAARTNLSGDPIPVDVLAYPVGSPANDRLQAYATTSGGRVLTATDAASASAAAAGAAGDFSAVLAVTAVVPAGLAGSTVHIGRLGRRRTAGRPAGDVPQSAHCGLRSLGPAVDPGLARLRLRRVRLRCPGRDRADLRLAPAAAQPPDPADRPVRTGPAPPGPASGGWLGADRDRADRARRHRVGRPLGRHGGPDRPAAGAGRDAGGSRTSGCCCGPWSRSAPASPCSSRSDRPARCSAWCSASSPPCSTRRPRWTAGPAGSPSSCPTRSSS